MEKEIRNFQIEFKTNPEERVIEGRAIPFNTPSPNREGFREVIAPEAVEGVIEKSDIKFYYNHDPKQGFLARNNKGKGTLKIDTREDGVYFQFTPAHDNLSEYIYERLQRGELDEMSWAFTCAEDTWYRDADGVGVRTITKFDRLFDFSVVDNSYYGIENAVACRSYEEFLEREKKENEEREEPQEEEPVVETPAEPEEKEEEKREEPNEEAEKEIAEKIASYYNNLRAENEKYLKK